MQPDELGGHRAIPVVGYPHRVPHIHTLPGQHDLTASAFIVRTDAAEPHVLVHRHKKLGRLMQVGGHVELEETPWSALAHEVREESGYDLDQLGVLQVVDTRVDTAGAVVHPIPFVVNTHRLPGDHLHTDLSFALVAGGPPRHRVDEGESADLYWLTLGELRDRVGPEGALADVAAFYGLVVERLVPMAIVIPAVEYSLADPVALSR